MKSKGILIIFVLLFITSGVFIYSRIKPQQITQNSTKANNTVDESETIIPLIEYTHPSSKFSYSYPSTWEFVPKREDMGLRPKEYSGYSKNEIITIIYFESKGSDLKAWAKTYDDGFDEDWIEKTIFNKPALYYNYKSDKLDNIIFYFGNGKDAVKIMFRKYYEYGVEGQKDNSRFENDFNSILQSFKFLN